MNPDDQLVAVAEGYLELGEFEEAWDYIEAIPVSIRIGPPFVKVRIVCAIALKKFEMAEDLACFLGTGPVAYRRFAGQVLHELAAAYCHAGDPTHARKLLADAVRVWPDERFAILDDPSFRNLA